MMNRFKYHKRWRSPFWSIVLPIILITTGVLLLIIFTPPWVWISILGLALILAGGWILRIWR